MKLSQSLIGATALLLALMVGCNAPPTSPPATDTPMPTDTPAPTSMPEEPTVTLRYEETAQFELIGPQGTRILTDVFDPHALASPAATNDVLLTTHLHSDHAASDFLDSFPGRQLRAEEGEIALPDVTIRSISAAHDGDEPNGSDYIFIIDTADLRIVHFGDIGQSRLTEEQLAAVGEADVAILAFDTVMNLNNRTFELMEQVQPKVIIPTHLDDATYAQARETWENYADTDVPTVLSRSDLPGETAFLVLGQWAPMYKTIYDLPEW